jgi:hypothetical protein
MIVDFLRPGDIDLETMGLAQPHFDHLTNPDPAFEVYDYIFLNDPELSKVNDDPAVKAMRSSYSRPTTTVMKIRRPISPSFGGSDRATIYHGRRSISERVIVRSRVVDSQKKLLLGTTQITEHQLLLMPCRVPAFSLNTKKWRMSPFDSYWPEN